ncbi:hypothetical protein cyc_03791 [Cyclospora cayetanensis]|uniref:Uncharacterized protein n=1 Tax=Cyclospora cayetanensis TaxID=88456 RepID=A0A1D3D2E3_9EIME|nr:hypothetical protein cyc_03791 [Cyclospora cayetanensis]
MERAHPAEFPSPSSFDPLSSPSRFCEPPAVPTLASLSSDASHGNVPAADEEASDAEEDLPCCRLSLPVHLALDRSKVIADFNRPHEGFSLYAAFSESAFALAAEGSLNQQQIADLHKLFQTVSRPPPFCPLPYRPARPSSLNPTPAKLSPPFPPPRYSAPLVPLPLQCVGVKQRQEPRKAKETTRGPWDVVLERQSRVVQEGGQKDANDCEEGLFADSGVGPSG